MPITVSVSAAWKVSYSYSKQFKKFKHKKVYLNDEKHPILYYRRIIIITNFARK